MSSCLMCGVQLTGKQKYCNECYKKHAAGRAKEYYKRKTGERRCKKCGEVIGKGKQFCPACKSTRWKDAGYYQRYSEECDKKRREFVDENNFGDFVYIGGFTKGNCIVTIQCKTCGEKKEIGIDSARTTINSNGVLRCRTCNPQGSGRRWAEWLKIKRARETEQKKATEQRKEQEKQKRLRTAVCAVCGKTFKTYQPNQKTCSKECGKRLRNLRRDHRIPNEAIVDRDITLATLYQRDKGVCYICGCSCDWNDIEKHDGYVITGPKYPSIDHIIPVSRGGKHAWVNIRLACRECNAKKTDNDPVEFLGTDEFIPENAEMLKRTPRPNKKMVRQSTKTGDLVGIYESAAEAARQTGFKERQIQNSARGESKSYRGFVWEYVQTEVESHVPGY